MGTLPGKRWLKGTVRVRCLGPPHIPEHWWQSPSPFVRICPRCRSRMAQMLDTEPRRVCKVGR